MSFEDFTEEVLDEEFPVKDSKRAQRRKKNIAKAMRKRDISRKIYGFNWYDNLHQFSKNKIFCSCNLCRFRPVFDPDQKTISDIKKEMSQNEKLHEYTNSDCVET